MTVLLAALLTLVSLLALTAAPALAAEAEPCPNERLREESNLDPNTERPYSTELPDCRAFEMVSPPFDGLGVIPPGRFAADGSRIFGGGIPVFAGGPSNLAALGNGYEFSRTSSGWQTTPLGPPVAEFVDAGVQGLIPSNPFVTDSGEALLGLRPSGSPAGENDIYHRAAGGTLSEVGPVLPPSAVPPLPVTDDINLRTSSALEGASADLSHVFFNITAPWPGAPGSLYEYVGTGNSEPELVDVRNAGTVAQAAAEEHKEHVNEAAELIGSCGAQLGGSRSANAVTHHNAVSADGETAFFTAERCRFSPPLIGELYARLGRVKTLAVSSPAAAEYPASQGEGAGPQECDAACHAQPHAEGLFQGASADGSKVFFLTAQPLLNSDEDNSTDLYMAEIQGSGEAARLTKLRQLSHDPIPSQPAEVQGLAAVSEDGSHAYFVARGVLTEAPNEYGATAQLGQDNLYAYDTEAEGPPVFLATLSPADASQWNAEGFSPMQTTPDGRFLLFTSAADITPDDSSSSAQLFRYDARNGRLIRISIGEGGREEDGNAAGAASLPRPDWRIVAEPQLRDPNPAITDDGSAVVFESEGALAAGAPATGVKAYEYENGHVYYIFQAKRRGALIAIDPSGLDIIFVTYTPLVPQDTSTNVAVYVARADGGFPAPASQPACSGDACQGAASPTPSAASPATPGFQGAGNERPCRRGTVRRQGKCVKKSPPQHRKRHAHSHRRAAR